MSMTNHLFTPTGFNCECGKAYLENLNGMLICPVCGFYKVQKYIGNITIKDKKVK